MIGRTIRFLQSRGAVSADFEQSIGELGSTLVLHPVEPFSDRFSDRFGHALSGNSSQLLGEFVGVFVLDVQAHFYIFYHASLPFYHKMLCRKTLIGKGVDRRDHAPTHQSSTQVHTQLGRAAVQIFAANERMNQMLIEPLDRAAWRAKPPATTGKMTPRTIAAIFTHMHNVRCKWAGLPLRI
jgi:hypothetical protein